MMDLIYCQGLVGVQQSAKQLLILIPCIVFSFVKRSVYINSTAPLRITEVTISNNKTDMPH